MQKEMAKQYDPKEVEGKIYKMWEDSGAFRAVVNKGKKPYTIVMPPPNITGQLHMGHAMDETLQDILYAYYHIGDIRNKINHAETSAMAENRLVVSESDDPTALVRVKECIDFFINSYEKAMTEVQGKKPNIVLITGDDVRIASEHMRRGSENRKERNDKH